jgi:chromosome segregation ATPase
MIWATQQVQRDFQATANKQNIATDSGIIEEIQCINFMCHEHLTVPLGPLINFIIGHNGSGKSAVLTALTICFGGKATATNRAQNLKSLIKEGKDHSSVQVRIKNQGALAYKPSQYGDSITVERHFNRSGTSGFKLKDQNGRVVSTKKAELEDILDAFSMQIDNPMNVLTQDMARQFLNNSTPKDKYMFFLKGTQLEVLSRDYQQIEASLELMNTKAEMNKTDIADLRKRMEELAKKARRAESLEKMRARETEIAHQALWAKVQEEEAGLADADTELVKIAALIEKRQRIVEEKSEAFERSDAAVDAAKQEVTELSTEKEPAQQEVQELKVVFEGVRSKLLTLKTDQRNAISEAQGKQKAVDKVKSDIEDLRQRQAEADDGAHAEKLRQLEEAKLQAEQAKETYSAHGTELPKLRNELKAAQQDKISADQQVQRARDEESRIRGNINRLRGGQTNWMEGYPRQQSLQRLLQAIGSDSRFREKPVGPMGRHVKLLRPEWGNILEKQFGGTLNAFVVTNRADSDTLLGLMKRCQWQAPVYIGKPTPINTTNHEPDPSHLTWMRALRFDNDLVRNQFIIHQSIEQTVLIESRAEGYELLQNRGPMARNVRMCFTFAEGDRRKGRVINVTSSGGINDSPIEEFRGVLRMQADKEDQIRQEQTRLEVAQREMQEFDDAANEMMNRLNACKRAEQNHVSQNRRLKIAYDQASDVVGRLDDELGEAAPDAASLDVLQDALTEAETNLHIANGVFEDMVVRKDSLNAENRENKDNLEAAHRKLAELDFKLNKAQATVRKYEGQRQDNLKAKNEAFKDVTAAKENYKLWEEDRVKRQTEVDNETQKAVNVCPQRVTVPQDKNSGQLAELLTKLSNTRKATEKELGGSQDELLREANLAKKAHQDAKREFDDIEGVKLVSEAVHMKTERLANQKLASHQYPQPPPPTVAAVPFRNLCASACHFQLSSQRAQIPWYSQHRPQEAIARHSCRQCSTFELGLLLTFTGSTRHHGTKWRWPADQDTVRR